MICHRFKLLGDGRVPYVAFKQNDKREDGIFNRDFQEKSFLMKSHHLIQYPCKWTNRNLCTRTCDSGCSFPLVLRAPNTQPYTDTCLPTKEPNQTQYLNLKDLNCSIPKPKRFKLIQNSDTIINIFKFFNANQGRQTEIYAPELLTLVVAFH